MARQFYSYVLPAEQGAMFTFLFEKPVRKILIKSAFSFQMTPGTAFKDDQFFSQPGNMVVEYDFQSKNTGKGLNRLTVRNESANVNGVRISVIEYGDINSGDDSYFLK
jgi:hypothetical protein